MDFAAESTFNTSSPVPSRALTPKPTTRADGVPSAQASSSSSTAPSNQSSSSGQASNEDAGLEKRSEQSVSLEQEVGQVVQQLSSWGGSFWGGLRKQSAVAFDNVKKDFSRTVQEAQEDLKKLQAQTVEVGLKHTSESETHSSVATTSKGKARESENEHHAEVPELQAGTALPSPHVPSAKETKDFFTKIGETFSSQSNNLNSTINQNLATLQKSLSESIASASAKSQIQSLNLNKLTRNDINFAQFADNIQKNLAQAGTKLNIQQAEKLAEEYLRKSEDLLHNAGEFLKDAVKVVPPESDGHGVVWDGSDTYAFSTADDWKNPSRLSSDNARATSFEVSRSQLRKEALLRRLRGDKELFLVDPGAETESSSRRSAFAAFCESEIKQKGGVDGTAFEESIEAELRQGDKETDTLEATLHDLVPSQLSKDVFWTRYFFHKYSIEDEEARRQRILQAAVQPEAEDFSWDEEDESPTTVETLEPVQNRQLDDPESVRPSATLAKAVDAQQNPASKSPEVTDSSNNSTRVSEESYVAVNAKTAKPSSGSTPENVGRSAQSTKEEPANNDGDDDDDSDWE
ncbi:hypothetical protein NliqN6_5040 [Naganishia liquefaciens]|uniref:BSD domain-containing protein n=1 Tax=Naganishia liquefaciens TaxID=104408 RepID=A0A8H3TXH4_9TREE|nr:hypothetical protein NliqN6_5040 [Naganishia liquefaciens]